jgi:hypothetical protein
LGSLLLVFALTNTDRLHDKGVRQEPKPKPKSKPKPKPKSKPKLKPEFKPKARTVKAETLFWDIDVYLGGVLGITPNPSHKWREFLLTFPQSLAKAPKKYDIVDRNCRDFAKFAYAKFRLLFILDLNLCPPPLTSDPKYIYGLEMEVLGSFKGFTQTWARFFRCTPSYR